MNTETQTLWNKGQSADHKIHNFTAGEDVHLDHNLAVFDLTASLAHAKMLYECGLLNGHELELISEGLNQMLKECHNGTFVIEDHFEDVHSKIEFELVRRVGDCGKKIHTARSRNDQVLVALHLYSRQELMTIQSLVVGLFNTLMDLAFKHKEVIMPGYTHLQIAMPSSFGLWFSSYAETLIDDILFLQTASKIADQNPLGSAAGYGSSFPINRKVTTEELGFSTMKYNSISAQMSRGKLEKSVSFALASLASTISKLAQDICLYSGQDFGFVKLPENLCTGSSIMPHKKNPDVMELVRGKCNQIQSLPYEFSLIINNLPTGYQRDVQLLKGSLMRSFETIKDVLGITDFCMKHIQINPQSAQKAIYQNMYSVEEVNKLVKSGLSFRDAYHKIGEKLKNGPLEFDGKLSHTHEGSIGNLCLDEIRNKLDQVLKRG